MRSSKASSVAAILTCQRNPNNAEAIAVSIAPWWWQASQTQIAVEVIAKTANNATLCFFDFRR
jgi:hypothetical protein